MTRAHGERSALHQPVILALGIGGSRWDNEQTAPAGSFVANGFGLHDMPGNVWEWVEDCYHGSYAGAPSDGSAWRSDCVTGSRMIRGGAWFNYAGTLRSYHRSAASPDFRHGGLGFHVSSLVWRPGDT